MLTLTFQFNDIAAAAALLAKLNGTELGAVQVKEAAAPAPLPKPAPTPAATVAASPAPSPRTAEVVEAAAPAKTAAESAPAAPSAETAPQASTAATDTPVTFDELKRAFLSLSTKPGGRALCEGVLKPFGLAKLSEAKPEQYSAVMAQIAGAA